MQLRMRACTRMHMRARTRVGAQTQVHVQMRIFVHAFDHPSRPEPARDVVLRLSGHSIEEIRQREIQARDSLAG